MQSVDWLLSKRVHVINRSNGANSGEYSANDAYIDYIVKTSKVTVVNAAGNAGDSKKISSPSLGVNVISVASNDKNLGVSSFSSAGLEENTASKVSKPTITAPGGGISGVKNTNAILNGTSFSAPMVTGVVALLMQEFSILKFIQKK